MIDWTGIDTVLLDMDGTVLDLRFDNVLWNELLPSRYARHHALTQEQARAALARHTERIAHSLDYYCLDQWARSTELDILALHRQLRHLIRYRPHAPSFLKHLRSLGKRLVLVTNAHRESLALKEEMAGLTPRLDRMICAHDLAAPKESASFWEHLAAMEPFDPARAALLDDNPQVLRAGAGFRIGRLLCVTQPDSSEPPRQRRDGACHLAFNHFDELLP